MNEPMGLGGLSLEETHIGDQDLWCLLQWRTWILECLSALASVCGRKRQRASVEDESSWMILSNFKRLLVPFGSER